MSVASLVFPGFMLVALGWALRHKFSFSREFFAGTERLVYFVRFPALCCSNRSCARRSAQATPQYCCLL